jgi:prefoldin subunit 5
MNNVHERLDELRSEAETGQRQLQLLDERRTELRDTLLRIAGAIQVLEEIAVAEETAAAAAGEVVDITEAAV